MVGRFRRRNSVREAHEGNKREKLENYQGTGVEMLEKTARGGGVCVNVRLERSKSSQRCRTSVSFYN